jgi:hypothetical protein
MDLMRIKRTVINRLILVLMVFFLSMVVFTAAHDYPAAEIGSCVAGSVCPAPGFPSMIMPLVMIIGAVIAVLYIEKPKEY